MNSVYTVKNVYIYVQQVCLGQVMCFLSIKDISTAKNVSINTVNLSQVCQKQVKCFCRGKAKNAIVKSKSMLRVRKCRLNCIDVYNVHISGTCAPVVDLSYFIGNWLHPVGSLWEQSKQCLLIH